jgi:predicted MFS family arabinose efflux permease
VAHGLWAIAGVLLLFFVAFNVLEAMQPSLVSRYAASARGAALGVYNTTQALGLFLGGAVGGWLLQHQGRAAVFLGCAGALLLWLIIAWNMKSPPARGHESASAAAATSATTG